MSKELKPCPCCGTRLQSEDIEHAPGESWGTCSECGLVAEMSWWNTRSREDELEAEVERLRRQIAEFQTAFKFDEWEGECFTMTTKGIDKPDRAGGSDE